MRYWLIVVNCDEPYGCVVSHPVEPTVEEVLEELWVDTRDDDGESDWRVHVEEVIFDSIVPFKE